MRRKALQDHFTKMHIKRRNIKISPTIFIPGLSSERVSSRSQVYHEEEISWGKGGCTADALLPKVFATPNDDAEKRKQEAGESEASRRKDVEKEGAHIKSVKTNNIS